MLRKTLRASFVVALTAGLAACAAPFSDLTIVGPTEQFRYTRSTNALFVGNGQLDLAGRSDNQALFQSLAEVAAENLPKGAVGAQFTLGLPEAGKPVANNRVLVVIGGAFDQEACKQRPEGGRFNGSELRVTAISCNGDTVIASTRGRISEISGPNDPQVARLFRQIGYELFPGRNIDTEREDRGDYDI